MLEHLVRLSEKIEENVGVVQDLIGVRPSRKRRGLINGLGTVLKAIAGNMDADDGERLEAEIATLQGTQDTLKEGMKKQLQVVETMIEMFNETSQASQRNLQKLFNMVHTVDGYFQNRTDALRDRQHFDESLTLIEASVEAYLREVDKMIELFSEVTSGTVSASTVTPATLTKYLTEALPHLPRGHSFPRPIARQNAAAILRLATARAYRKEKMVTLILEIPLIGPSEYNLNYVYPLPRRGSNNTYYYIHTTEDLVVVDRKNRQYIRMTERDLETCKIADDKYYCKPRHPVMGITEDAPCSIRLYIEGAVGHGQPCPKKIILLTHTLVMGMRQPGQWLYIAPSEETASVGCQGEPTQQEMLHGAGLVALQERCTVTTAAFKLETVRRWKQRINDICYVPSYNLTLLHAEAEEIPKTIRESRKTTLEHAVTNPRELNEVGTQIRNMQENLDRTTMHETRNPTSLYHVVGQYSVGAVALFALAGYIIINALCRRAKSEAIRLPSAA